MRVLTLMQGIPGSGKSTVARGLAAELNREGVSCMLLSTDDFWGESYDFDPGKLGTAHRWNQLRAQLMMESNIESIIIDNTNIDTRAWHPYLDLAEEHGYEIQFIRVSCELDTALARNAARPENRQVPEVTVRRMYERLEQSWRRSYGSVN